MKYISILMVSLVLMLGSCVTSKKYKQVAADLEQCKSSKGNLDKQFRELTDIANQAGATISSLRQDIKGLKNDTAILGEAKRSAEASVAGLTNRLSDLESRTAKKSQMTDAEMKKMMAELQKGQEALFQKQDSVNKLIAALDEKQQNLFVAQNTLKDQQRRVKELESILNERDSINNVLRKTVSDALVGFVGNGLTVHMKDGQVYVSMEESLLFKTASWQVGPKGIEALKKLANVLEKQNDINVMVEGHTDNVTFNGPGQVRDNWDLSVMRATSVTKILLQSGEIKPSRITAAGRGEYFPIDPANTMEARAKNRRTEIILTPKLDQLMKIIGNK
ncbi:MAG: OmpA family protein [Bacteroidota bacterium]